MFRVLFSNHWVVHFQRKEYLPMILLLFRLVRIPEFLFSGHQSDRLYMVSLHERRFCSSQRFVLFLFLQQGWLFLLGLHW